MALSIGRIKVESFQECGRVINKAANRNKRPEIIYLNNKNTVKAQPNKLFSWVASLMNKFSK